MTRLLGLLALCVFCLGISLGLDSVDRQNVAAEQRTLSALRNVIAVIPDQVKSEQLPPPKEPVAIEGYYAVEGKMRDGKDYDGVVSIRKHGGQVYVVSWSNGQAGVALWEEPLLVVGYGTGEMAVVVKYQLQGVEPVRFVGKWASLPGQPVVAEERLEFLRPLKKP